MQELAISTQNSALGLTEPAAIHRQLKCGIEMAVLPLPHRPVVTLEFRFLTGYVHEPPEKLGLNRLVEQTITKGTTRRTGRELSDAFDAKGIRWSSWAGREATSFLITCLPEFLDSAMELQAEFLTTPTFPQDALRVTIENSITEISHLSDDPQELSAKLFARQIYGPVLGRHVLGESETISTITQEDIHSHWRGHYGAGRMQVSAAGPIDPVSLENRLNALYSEFGNSVPAGRDRFPFEFQPITSHHAKDLEQEQIGIGFPGASLDDPLHYTQRVVIGLLAGGMSSRLFTEVREKQGLVYWVSAWTEHPRGIGMVFLGASTTPERCEKTFETLLREVDRLGEDVTQDELQRVITGIVARTETRGDITRARCSELADHLFHYGKIIPRDELLARIRAVTLENVRTYLQRFQRNRLSVLTLGPKELRLEHD